MKFILLVSAVALLVLTTTAFAAFIYWGHPYMGVNHHKSGPYVMGEGSDAFGGCPYLQQFHEGLESPYLKDGQYFHPWQGPSLSPAPNRGQEVIEI